MAETLKNHMILYSQHFISQCTIHEYKAWDEEELTKVAIEKIQKEALQFLHEHERGAVCGLRVRSRDDDSLGCMVIAAAAIVYEDCDKVDYAEVEDTLNRAFDEKMGWRKL